MIIFSLKVGKFDLVSMIILLSALETLLAEYLLTVNIRRRESRDNLITT